MSLFERRLKIGVVCYPTFGGSGIIATEIAHGMARRGHQVHVVSYDVPARLDATLPNISFHAVAASDYPLFEQQRPYAIALASKLVELTLALDLDLVHVHYAVPHATSAWLAREVLLPRRLAVVTTLHGTDITQVGSDPSYQSVTRMSIEKSDVVTVPSQFLKEATFARLGVGAHVPIHVVPNFVDTSRFRPALKLRVVREGPPVILHASNFRPVKRTLDVVGAFEIAQLEQACSLVLVGDGPDRAAVEAWVRDRGLSDRVSFLGRRDDFVSVIQDSDIFLLPSESESFGVAALEAMACGLPCVASDVGGLPELIEHGITGLLGPVGDVAAHAQHLLALLGNPELRARLGAAARHRAVAQFGAETHLDRYEALYREALLPSPNPFATSSRPRPS